MKKNISAYAAVLAAGALLSGGAHADTEVRQPDNENLFIAAESSKVTELRPRFMQVVDANGAPVMVHVKDQDGRPLYAVKSENGSARVIAPEMSPSMIPASANTESRFMEVVNSYNVVPRFADACVKGRDGQDYTVRMQFVLGVRAGDIGIDMNKRNARGEKLVYEDFSPVLKRLDDYAEEVAAKFPEEMAARALSHVSDIWRQTVKGMTKEDIGYMTSTKGGVTVETLNKEIMSPEFMPRIQAALAKLGGGDRLMPDKPGFTGETGIRIIAGSAIPGGATPGCKP